MTLTLRTRTHATAWHGAALIAQGSYEGGIAEMRRGFAAFRATGGMPFAMFWYYLACGLGRSGRPRRTSSGGGRTCAAQDADAVNPHLDLIIDNLSKRILVY